MSKSGQELPDINIVSKVLGPKTYVQVANLKSFLAMLADGGYQVGSLAKCYYPDGEEVTTLNHKEALAETTELLKREFS